jgi:hypothetical protein
LFTFKLDGKMWIKIYNTVQTSKPNSAGGYIEANLPNAVKPIGFIGNKSRSAKMHDAVSTHLQIWRRTLVSINPL